MDIYTATAFRKIFSGGVNKPLLIEALATSGNRREIVLKPYADEIEKKRKSQREIIALHAASKIGISTVIPCTVKVSTDFVDTLPPLYKSGFVLA